MTIYLEVAETLTPKESKQQVLYTFKVEEPIDQLIIYFNYTPKQLDDLALAKTIIKAALPQFMTIEQQKVISEAYLEGFLPLKNLLTVSVDDPHAFRGSAHRQPPEQKLVLAMNSATPGFIPGPLHQGEWSIVISSHAVVTEECHYSLLVVGEEGQDVQTMDSL